MSQMNSITSKLGFRASLIALFSFVLYTFCFVAILLVNQPFAWDGIANLAIYEAESVSWLKYLGMGSMILYACAYVVIVMCTNEAVKKEKQIYSWISVVFGIAFCVCTSIGYFVQLTSTRLQLESGHVEGLVQFTQSYHLSAINGINILGWTLFYGISSLAFGFAIGDGFGKVLKIACVANAFIMFAGLIGFVSNNFWILLFTLNFGLGGAGITIIISLLRWYGREQRRYK